MNRLAVPLSGAAGPVEVELAFLGTHKVFVNGVQVPQRKGRHSIPMADGRTLEAKVVNGFAQLQLKVGGTRHPVGERSPTPLVVVAMLPIALLAIGGCIGGFFGALAVTTNLVLLRQPLDSWAKVALMLAVGVVAGVAFAVAGAVFTLMVGDGI